MKRALFLCLLATTFDCSRASDNPHDAGPKHKDASTKQAGAAGTAGKAVAEAGIADAAARDAGSVDAGHPHPQDASTVEATHPMDASRPDASPADAHVEEPSPRTHGLQARIENTTCFLNGTPPLAIVAVGNTPAFSGISATGALALVNAGSRLAVVESRGRLRSFAPDGDGSDATTVLDLGSGVRADGLRGAAFRPNGGALVLSFIPTDDPLRLVVARFALNGQGVADLASKEPLLTVPLSDAKRAGGALAFLFDGTLAIAFGDGGDTAAVTDRMKLAGKVARIDVGGASGYMTPTDNPLLSDSSARPEIFALGLGSPSSCTVDRVTGHLWCGDTGDASNDQVMLVTPGATLHGILSFARTGCGVRVGFVSRDTDLPDIEGALVFGDDCSPTLKAMRFDGSLVRSQGDITTLPMPLAAFGEDQNGHMLAVDTGNAIHALVRPATQAPSFPTSVSATGCIADMATRAPAASLIPFEVRTPLWSDGAKKHRFIILPAKQTIGFTTEGAWQFPVGTMFMKEFLLDDDNDTKTPDPIMETRFLIKRSDTSWEGYSYMWDRDRKDAFLLDGAEIGNYRMQPHATDTSGASVHRHTFPDRTQCLLCHNEAAGRALGLQTGRMNTDHDYGGFVENQLHAMDYIGLFTAPLPAQPDALPRFPQPADATSGDLEGRARSWLYANCSHCHRPGGPTPVALDFRFETALADTHACGVTPRFNISQIPDAKIINPGMSANSELFFRISRRDQNQMPPIASLITEPTGLDVVQRWIDGLSACP